MSKILKSRGQHWELPILGQTLAELRLDVDRLVRMTFRSEAGEEAHLEIEEAITLSRGRSTQILEGSRPGSSFAPQTLAPLVELLGCTVTDALAQKDGTIRVELSNQMMLSIVPTRGYEGWHFQGKPEGHSAPPLILHGATGHLIGIE